MHRKKGWSVRLVRHEATTRQMLRETLVNITASPDHLSRPRLQERRHGCSKVFARTKQGKSTAHQVYLVATPWVQQSVLLM